MKIEIVELPSRRLIGRSISMSFVENKTGQLFGSFMPMTKRLKMKSAIIYDVRVYPPNYHLRFDPTRTFVKWVAVDAIDDPADVGLQSIDIPAGRYAVFSEVSGPEVFQYIFSEWLPSSGYQLDDRPHFDELIPGEQPGTTQSESYYIPIK